MSTEERLLPKGGSRLYSDGEEGDPVGMSVRMCPLPEEGCCLKPCGEEGDPLGISMDPCLLPEDNWRARPDDV